MNLRVLSPSTSRVISMVPSWTETLIGCGANVVGRTRFCTEPIDQVRSIPVVGGTKDINWEKIQSLTPTLLVLDRDENPKSFSEFEIPWVASHVRSTVDLPKSLIEISGFFANVPDVRKALESHSQRWENLLKKPMARPERSGPSFALDPPAVDWRQPVLYLIWRNPYMAIGPNTFIASMLKHLGFELGDINTCANSNNTYPEIDIKKIPKNWNIFLSSEPYPFHIKKAEVEMELIHSGVQNSCIVVNGQALSWFGVRALRFLESIL